MADLVTFTQEILNGKLDFLCSDPTAGAIIELSIQAIFFVTAFGCRIANFGPLSRGQSRLRNVNHRVLGPFSIRVPTLIR